MFRYAAATICLFFGLWAARHAVGEYTAFRESARPLNEQITRATGDDFAWVDASSLQAQISQMHLCVEAQQSIVFGLFPATSRTGFTNACQDRATEILATTPTLSIALLARAVSSFRSGDQGEARKSLSLSRLAAPREGWIAAQRLNLALSLADLGDGEALGIVAGDVLLMAEDARLRDDLARLYRRSRDHQEAIISILEQAPAEHQRSFLAAVRRTNES